jgi:hypothetical protein
MVVQPGYWGRGAGIEASERNATIKLVVRFDRIDV